MGVAVPAGALTRNSHNAVAGKKRPTHGKRGYLEPDMGISEGMCR